MGYEAVLSRMADAPLGMDAADYKHLARGLIIVKRDESAICLSIAIWHLAKMNPGIREIDGGFEQGDPFLGNSFHDLKADQIPANPPFSTKGVGKLF